MGSRVGGFSPWWGEDPHQHLLWGVHQTLRYFMLSGGSDGMVVIFPLFSDCQVRPERQTCYLAVSAVNSYFRKSHTASVL